MKSSDEFQEVMRRYHYTCTYPGCFAPAADLHHEPPKSLPGTAEQKLYPLCLLHHKIIQDMNRESARHMLEEGADMVLDFYS